MCSPASALVWICALHHHYQQRPNLPSLVKRHVLSVLMSLLTFLYSSDESYCTCMYSIRTCFIRVHINIWNHSRRRERRAAEGETAGWHHRLSGHELGQTPGNSEGRGGLACSRSWGRKEAGATWQLRQRCNPRGSLRLPGSTCTGVRVQLSAALSRVEPCVTTVTIRKPS